MVADAVLASDPTVFDWRVPLLVGFATVSLALIEQLLRGHLVL